MNDSSLTQDPNVNMSALQRPETQAQFKTDTERQNGLAGGVPAQGGSSSSRWELVDALLSDRTYHIEFNGGLSNHDKHAVIALNGIGASTERIKSYYESYAVLTPYGYPLEPPKASKHAINRENWKFYLGKRTSFSSYCEFFDQAEKELGMEEMLRRYLPVVVPGWVGVLTHATIHLGWALDVNHRWMIIEGLAYMVFSYISCNPLKQHAAVQDASAEKTVFDSLLRVASGGREGLDALKNWTRKILAQDEYSVANGFHPELARLELQHKIATILAEGHSLIEARPGWMEAPDLCSVWYELYYTVTVLYMSRPGDFLILHLITSLYGMEQIAMRVTPEEQRVAVQCFWKGMLAILLAYNEIPSKTELQALDAKYRNAVDLDGKPDEGPDWGEIAAQAALEAEEHNPKLVYVQQRIWKRYSYRSIFRAAAAKFTATPKLPAIFDQPPAE